jgi:hypothetical protein
MHARRVMNRLKEDVMNHNAEVTHARARRGSVTGALPVAEGLERRETTELVAAASMELDSSAQPAGPRARQPMRPTSPSQLKSLMALVNSSDDDVTARPQALAAPHVPAPPPGNRLPAQPPGLGHSGSVIRFSSSAGEGCWLVPAAPCTS